MVTSSYTSKSSLRIGEYSVGLIGTGACNVVDAVPASGVWYDVA